MFAVGFAVLAIDFILRLLVIEKKIASKYEAEDPDSVSNLNTTPSDQQDGTADEEQRGEETQPLLSGKEDDKAAYKLSDKQPWICHRVPILPCLTNARLLTAFLVAFVQALLLGSFDATIPTVSKDFFDFDSLKSGILFIPIVVFDLLLGPLFGWCVDRYGTKPVSVIGYTYLVPVLVLLRLPHSGGKEQIALFASLLALCGIGLASIGAPSLVEAGAIIEKYYEVNPDFFGENGPYAQMYGFNSMVFGAGFTVGPELAGELKQAIGYGNMNLVLAVICAATATLCFVFIGGRPGMLARKKA